MGSFDIFDEIRKQTAMFNERETQMATKQQYEATAKFHDRVAEVFAQLGQHKNSEDAKRAAELCRENAKKCA